MINFIFIIIATPLTLIISYMNNFSSFQFNVLFFLMLTCFNVQYVAMRVHDASKF